MGHLAYPEVTPKTKLVQQINDQLNACQVCVSVVTGNYTNDSATHM